MASPEKLEAGLYLISTPIGNLGDITVRARETLAEVDLLLAEDTRHSRKLMNHLGIDRQMTACHEHNETVMAERVVTEITSGNSCGLITDAGTPGISDPGFRLVRACRKAGLPVFAVPGASALVAALSISGLPTDSFRFYGFLPPKKAARIRHFTEVASARETLVYYESTHRVEKFLEDAGEVFGTGRVVTVARELTKRHETVLTGTIEEIKRALLKGSTKGEFVIMIAKEGFGL